MPSKFPSGKRKPANSGPSVMLASPDSLLILDLQRTLGSLGCSVQALADSEAVLAALSSLEGSAILLLDTRLGELANGRLLAAIHDSGMHQQCPVALVADQVSDEWIARLREGIIDDIVPRSSTPDAWHTHLNTMQRGHRLYCELQQLRQAALSELQRDSATGLFNRETMLTLLFRETDRVQRLRGAMCLILLEIDDLTHWTGALGQPASDRLLREVSARTGRILRSYDLFGRIAGDQFLLALPGCSAINAVMMAERLRIEVFGEPFAIPHGPKDLPHVRLTASFGIVSSHGRSPVVVLREAEQTVALAKQDGPDSMRCASDSPLSAESSRQTLQLFTEAGVLA